MKITKNLIRLQKPKQWTDDIRTSKQPEIAQIAPIVWPKAARVWAEAITVIIVTAALAIIIAAMDFGLRIGIETLTQF